MSEFITLIEDEKGLNRVSLHPDHKHITYVGVLNLESGSDFSFETEGSEFGLLFLEGSCTVKIEGTDYGRITSRDEVFTGLPYAVYVPMDSAFTLTKGRAKVAVFGGRCNKKTKPALIAPQDIKIMDVGKDNWSREVRIIIGPEGPSVNIILGETLNPPGNWSGTPPHKHEIDDLPKESLHEEVYYFRTDKPQGWGIERIYSPERGINDLLFLRDNSVTFMPWGYHQIVAAPGYTLYYSFFLAGEGKQLIGCEDQGHCWIKTS